MKQNKLNVIALIITGAGFFKTPSLFVASLGKVSIKKMRNV